MHSGDIILTPLYLLLIYLIAYSVQNSVTNKFTVKYFIPALTVKIIGAIAIGLIYQFYYEGGDTYNYFNHSKVITQAFYDEPRAGIKLLFSNGEYDQATRKYTAWLRWYNAPSEFFVAKVAAIFGIIGLNVYTVIAIFFALLSFSGMWAMYITFYKMYPNLHKKLAIAVFFLPSVYFWGSGLMKDSITICALGWLFYGFYNLFVQKTRILTSFILTLIAVYIIYTVKVYILLSFLPPALFWVFTENNRRIKSVAVRNLAKPIFIGLGLVVAYLGATRLTEGDERYDVDKIGERTKINSEYLSEYQESGSAYHIGTFDGSLASMVLVAPQAIIVSLFRPFIWEVRNPVMLLSAIEATLFIFLTFRIIFKTGFFKALVLVGSKPILTFCFVFSLILAFGVGTNSGNFGTLVRYKIPLMPFYLSALYIMQHYVNKPKKIVRFAKTA